jgi:hypothetical protein
MATKPKKPADDACQAKTGTQEQQDPAGKDKGKVPDAEETGTEDSSE